VRSRRRRIHSQLRRRAGIALFECLMAIAISAGLLTATAFALDASIKAFHINQQQSILMQNTRLAMTRILSTVRRCKLHAPDAAAQRVPFAAGKTVTDGGITMFDHNNQLATYRYDPATKIVNFIGNDGKSYPLIHGVEEFIVTLEPMRSPSAVRTGAGYDLLKRVTVQITVKTTEQTALAHEGVGRVKLTLSGSVMPRRNTW
jgi:hypothetical protein